MKKYLIVFALILSPFLAFGATKVVQELKWYDFIVQMPTQNNGNVFVNKFEDAGNTCYIMTSDSTKWGGINYGISCVNSVVKK
jgi:hypothetical protein